MKFQCLKEHLERALSTSERFTGKNLTLPILSHVLLEAINGSLKVSATNLEFAVECGVSGNMSKEGKVSVPGRVFSSFLQNSKDEKVVLEEKQGNLTVKTNSRDIHINGVPTEDFPIIPKVKKNNSFSFSAGVVESALKKVIPAVSVSEFKPELSGVLFSVSPRELKIAATDTFRLAECVVPISSKDEKTYSFILPARTAAELARTLEDSGETIITTIGDNQVSFEGKSFRITSRLIEGSFPAYSSLIPKNFKISAHANRRNLLENIRTSSIFASKLQDVALTVSERAMEISSANSDIGSYKTTLPVEASGKGISISFNHRYLLDGLSSLDEEECFIGINDESSPSLIRNRSDGSFFYVLMPIRTA